MLWQSLVGPEAPSNPSNCNSKNKQFGVTSLNPPGQMVIRGDASQPHRNQSQKNAKNIEGLVMTDVSNSARV